MDQSEQIFRIFFGASEKLGAVHEDLLAQAASQFPESLV